MIKVVRRWAVEMTHVADIPEGSIVQLRAFGAEFPGVATPIATRCGRILHGQWAVVMLPGTKVRCAPCRRLTGIETAPTT